MIREPTSSGLPMKSAVSSEPFSTMTPPISWPSVNGHGRGLGQWPLRMWRSVPHTPQAPIWIRAAFAGTCGRGTSRITGGAPGPAKVATRMPVMRRHFRGLGAKACDHLPADAHGKGALVQRDVLLADDRARRHLAAELHAVREADRQGALGVAAGGRHELAVDRVAAFAVEGLADLERALGDRHGVAAPGLGGAGRLAAQRRVEDRDRELEPDQVEGLVHGRDSGRWHRSCRPYCLKQAAA